MARRPRSRRRLFSVPLPLHSQSASLTPVLLHFPEFRSAPLQSSQGRLQTTRLQNLVAPAVKKKKNLPVMQETACNIGDRASIAGSGRSVAEGNGNPLQYSCLGNPMDRVYCWSSFKFYCIIEHADAPLDRTLRQQA